MGREKFSRSLRAPLGPTRLLFFDLTFVKCGPLTGALSGVPYSSSESLLTGMLLSLPGSTIKKGALSVQLLCRCNTRWLSLGCLFSFLGSFQPVLPLQHSWGQYLQE